MTNRRRKFFFAARAVALSAAVLRRCLPPSRVRSHSLLVARVKNAGKRKMGIEDADDRPSLPPAAPQARGGGGGGGGRLPRRFSHGGGGDAALMMARGPPPLPPQAAAGGTAALPGHVRRSASASLVAFRNSTSSSPNLHVSDLRRTTTAVGGETSSNSNWDHPALAPAVVAPKISIRVHRHLADQHLLGVPSVNDENGTMAAGERMICFLRLMRSECAALVMSNPLLLRMKCDSSPPALAAPADEHRRDEHERRFFPSQVGGAQQGRRGQQYRE